MNKMGVIAITCIIIVVTIIYFFVFQIIKKRKYKFFIQCDFQYMTIHIKKLESI